MYDIRYHALVIVFMRQSDSEKIQYINELYGIENDVLKSIRASAPIDKAHMQVSPFEGAILKFFATYGHLLPSGGSSIYRVELWKLMRVDGDGNSLDMRWNPYQETNINYLRYCLTVLVIP